MESTPPTFEVVEVKFYKLSDVCRTCLCRTNKMTSFYPKNETTSDLIAMLANVSNCEIEMNEYLPCYLCENCEAKLRQCYEFQLLMQKSNQIIQQCLNEGDVVSDVGKIEEKEVVVKKRKNQISPKEIEKAIEKCKQAFFINVTCIKCGFESSNTRALAVHMRHIHKELKDYWCSVCNNEVVDLPQHLHSHANNDFKCQFCYKISLSRGRFIEHLRSHSTIKPFTCRLCDKAFISQRYLNKHLRIHAKQGPRKCPFCPRTFIIPNAMQKHLKNHSQFTCAKCDSYYPTRRQYDDHNCLQRAGDLPEKQNFCKLCARRVRSLQSHIKKIHSNSGEAKQNHDRVLCTVCGKQFRTGSKLMLHMRVHTGETPYKCQFCDKRTVSRGQLVVHERTHTGEKPHICNICGKGFAQSSVLNTHMKIHTGRPEMCEICMKRFCRPAQLRLHMRKHTGEKPYLCQTCGQGFKQKSHLVEHSKTHSDERPFKCQFCDKGFKQNSSLKAHIRIHLGSKPFKCSQCPYACRQSYSLTQHMRQHSADLPMPERPHLCSICQKGFNTVAMLTSHFSVAHNNN